MSRITDDLYTLKKTPDSRRLGNWVILKMPKLYELLLTKSTLLGWSRWRSTHRAERRSSEIFRFRPVSESSSGRETVSATIISGNHCIKSSAQCIVIVTCHSARPKMVCAFARTSTIGTLGTESETLWQGWILGPLGKCQGYIVSCDPEFDISSKFK